MDFPIENGDFHSYVSLPEGNPVESSTGAGFEHCLEMGMGQKNITRPKIDGSDGTNTIRKFGECIGIHWPYHKNTH